MPPLLGVDDFDIISLENMSSSFKFQSEAVIADGIDENIDVDESESEPAAAVASFNRPTQAAKAAPGAAAAASGASIDLFHSPDFVAAKQKPEPAPVKPSIAARGSPKEVPEPRVAAAKSASKTTGDAHTFAKRIQPAKTSSESLQVYANTKLAFDLLLEDLPELKSIEAHEAR